MPLVPKIVEPDAQASPAALVAMLHDRGAELERDLNEHGVVLFRGFAVVTPAELADVVRATGEGTLRYVGGDSPRSSVHADVYTSTETPASFPIVLHNEMSYSEVHPRRLWFCCGMPATEGGETTLADGRAILADLDRRVRDRFEHHGVTYIRALRGKHRLLEAIDRVAKVTRSWMETFETDDREVVARACRAMGATFRFTDEDWLHIETTRPATVLHPVTGQRAWFNQAHLFHLCPRAIGRLRHAAARVFFGLTGAWSHDARFGDGSELERDTLDHVFDVMEAHTLRLRWQRGDVAWIDNLLTMHGRAPFRGERRIFVTMTA